MRNFLTWAGIVLLVLLVAFIAFYIWASAPGHDEESYSQIASYPGQPLTQLPDTFTVATYNIGYLSGMVNNLPIRESEDFYASNLASARDLMTRMRADIIGFQEIDFGSRRSYDYQQMDSLAWTYGYVSGAMAVNWDTRYVPFPYGMPRVHFGRVLSGQAVLSRLPISRQDRIVLEMPPNPFWYNAFYLDRLAQIAYFDTEPRLAVINVHLEAFHRETRERQAQALTELVDSLATDHAVVLIGDFNAIPDQFYGVARIDEEELSQRTGERTMEILEAHPVLEPVYAHGFFDGVDAGTYPADAPAIKIDHILFDRRYFRPVDGRILDAEGPPSDHRPVVARLAVGDPSAEEDR